MLDALSWMGFRGVLVRAHEGIGILVLLQVRQGVVDLSVLSLVCSDVQQEVLHGPVALWDVPVVDCEVRDGELGVGPLRELPGLEVLDGEGVGEHGLLLEVADEAVAGARGHEVGEEHAVEEDALGAEDHEFHEPAGLGHLEECEEVHALVVGLLQQRLDPAVVPLHPSEAVEMAKHAGHHSWDASHGFEEHEPDEPLAFAHGVGFGASNGVFVPCFLCRCDIVLVTSCCVGDKTQHADHGQGHAV